MDAWEDYYDPGKMHIFVIPEKILDNFINIIKSYLLTFPYFLLGR